VIHGSDRVVRDAKAQGFLFNVFFVFVRYSSVDMVLIKESSWPKVPTVHYTFEVGS
jgi:hypothetical protein